MHELTGKWERFESAVEMLLKIQKIVDDNKMPQPFSEMRCFAPADEIELVEHDVPETRTGRFATFNLRILFRQNASWQGAIKWIEGKQEQSFRSVLELLNLMHSALCAE